MKYIQCPHCSKKYAANKKVSAAAGKSIRCKQCKQAFEIIILDSVNQAPLSTEKERSDQAVDTRSAHRKSKPTGKRLNHQFLMLIALLSVVSIACIAVMVTYVYPDLFSSFSDQSEQSEQIKRPPGDLAALEAAHMRRSIAKSDDKKKTEKTQSVETPAPAKSLLQGPENPDQDCKDAAARQWISDRVLVAGKIPPEMYAKLLDQSLELTADVRKLCKDKFLVGRITEAAKVNAIPEWIKKEIEADLITQ